MFKSLLILLYFLFRCAIASEDVILSNYKICETMAKDYLEKYQVTTPELAIITSVCEGIVNPLDPGLAGGFHAAIYNGNCDEGFHLDASVMTPSEYVRNSTKPFADTGVPTMLKGYQYLYNMNICGVKPVLQWKDLFTENIKLARNGWTSTNYTVFRMMKFDHSLMVNQTDYWMQNPALATVLEQIAKDGPYSSSLYTAGGDLHSKMMTELGDVSFVTSADLTGVQVEKDSLLMHQFLDYKIITTKSHSSGLCVVLGLKIVESVFNKIKSLNIGEQVEFLYHTLRYMYSMKLLLDKDDVLVDDILENSSKIGQKIFTNLNNKWDLKPLREFSNYKIDSFPFKSSPKSAVNNIIIQRGKYAISLSTNANRRGGRKLFSKTFGTVYNNLLKDFDDSTEGFGKRPISYSAPLILASKRFAPVFIIGATGQHNPFGSIMNVMFHYFVNNRNLEEASKIEYCTPKYRNDKEYIYCHDLVDVNFQMLLDGFDFSPLSSDYLHGGVMATSTVRNTVEMVSDPTKGVAVVPADKTEEKEEDDYENEIEDDQEKSEEETGRTRYTKKPNPMHKRSIDNAKWKTNPKFRFLNVL